MNRAEGKAARIKFESTIPILRIFDVKKAREFYVEWLGFTVDWEHRFEPGLPLYMQISRGNLHFHLSEHHGDCTPGSTVFVNMKGVREFHREIGVRKYPNMRPGIRRMPWHADVMEVIDPFGNRIRFNEYVQARHAAGESRASNSIPRKPARKKTRSQA